MSLTTSVAIAVAAVTALTAATCAVDPDLYPLARDLSPTEYQTVSRDWEIASRILGSTLCAQRLGLDPEKVRRAHRWAIIVGRATQCDGELIAYVPRDAAVIVLCPRYWGLQPIDRVTIIIHELAHIAGGEHEASTQASVAYSRMIIERCVLPWAQRQSLLDAGPSSRQRPAPEREP